MQRPGHKSGTMRPEGRLCTPGSAVYPAYPALARPGFVPQMFGGFRMAATTNMDDPW